MRHCDYFFRKIKSKNPDNPTDQITDPTRPTRHSKSRFSESPTRPDFQYRWSVPTLGTNCVSKR